ncbi:hypothetical protein FQR65_LT20919 [Abscondita terminalis]|nr:hypothetical protein FQR65_LT20919 [Abscondita terminalis]
MRLRLIGELGHQSACAGSRRAAGRGSRSRRKSRVHHPDLRFGCCRSDGGEVVIEHASRMRRATGQRPLGLGSRDGSRARPRTGRRRLHTPSRTAKPPSSVLLQRGEWSPSSKLEELATVKQPPRSGAARPRARDLPDEIAVAGIGRRAHPQSHRGNAEAEGPERREGPARRSAGIAPGRIRHGRAGHLHIVEVAHHRLSRSGTRPWYCRACSRNRHCGREEGLSRFATPGLMLKGSRDFGGQSAAAMTTLSHSPDICSGRQSPPRCPRGRFIGNAPAARRDRASRGRAGSHPAVSASPGVSPSRMRTVRRMPSRDQQAASRHRGRICGLG